jgi:hypothetical protein
MIANPYSDILSDSGISNLSQGDLSFVYLVMKALEADYSSGYTGTVTSYRYAVESLEGLHGRDCVAVRRIRALFSGMGKLQGQ